MASAGTRDWRSVCESFHSARVLSEIRTDPESDPFRSKYKARDLLKEIYCRVKSEEEEEDGGGAVDGASLAGLRAAKLGVIDYYLGVNHIESEELSAGEEFLMNALQILEVCSVSRENVSLLLQVRVQQQQQQPCVYSLYW